MSFKKTSTILIGIILLAGLLRFYKISSIPPGLYSDEVSIGFNAYSIAQTGRDEHGQTYPLLFQAYGEYKLPIYIYATTISMFAFGKTDFAVRFPSALAGTLTVLLTYFLVKELFRDKTLKIKHQALNIAAVAALLLAISPWHLQFSRAGFEANLALFFLVSGTLAFLKSFNGRPTNLIFSVVLFFFAATTYNSARLFAPLFLVAMVWIFRNKIKKIKKQAVIAFALGAILSLPFILQVISGEALIRVHSEAIFKEDKPITRFFSNYFANFDTTFLFFRGDQNGRHSVRKLGMLYLFELPLILLGLKTLRKTRGDGKKVLLAWLLIAPIPASLTTINPHALRSLNILPTWQIFSALGLIQVLNFVENQRKHSQRILYTFFVVIVIIYSSVLYLHQYYVHYTRETALDWQDGIKEAVEILADRYDRYEEIFVSDKLPPVYIGFYLPVDPEYFQTMDIKEGIGKITYFSYAAEIQKQSEKKALIIAHFWQTPPERIEYQQVKMVNGDTVFNIWED